MYHNAVIRFQARGLINRRQLCYVRTKCLSCDHSTDLFAGFSIYNFHDRKKLHCYAILHFVNSRGLNHFFLPCRGNRSCWHLGNTFPWPLCLLCTWLSRDNHFALISSPSPLGVDTALQYRWLITLFIHSPISSHSFSLATFSSFFLRPIKNPDVQGNNNIHVQQHGHTIIISLAFCEMPSIIAMIRRWKVLSYPLRYVYACQ